MSGGRPRTDPASPGRIVAHRGASRVAPENTLAAFRAARRQGAEWVEFDVTLLGDGTPVVHHDAVLGRCTSGEGALSRLGRGDLARIDAGAWFGPEYAGEPLPTLETTLDLLDDADLCANLEIKPHGAPPEVVAEAVATALGARSWAASRILVSSFEIPVLDAFRRLRPEQPVAVLWVTPPQDWADKLHALSAIAVHVERGALSPELLASAVAEGVDLRVFTVNDPDEMAAFRIAGLAGVITDDPAAFLADPGWASWAEG